MKAAGKKLAVVFVDISIAALLLLGIYIINYTIPQKGIKAAASSVLVDDTENNAGNEQVTQGSVVVKPSQVTSDGLVTTRVRKDAADWHVKFADHFTPSVVADDLSYSSPDLSIQITKGSYDSGIRDYTEKGKHKKYGTRVAYTLADIYVGDITCFQSAFAKDVYGNGYSEKLTDMSARLGSVLAVNGDSYNNNRHQDNGTIIRNGVIYRSQKTDMETCVLNWGGSMQIYSPEELNTQTLIDQGAYQSWIFGPSLLEFLSWDRGEAV